jgi:hypothetical protein
MSAATLVLRDIHQPPAPPWWPPAPGWWIVFAAMALLLVAIGSWWWLRQRRRRAIASLFDAALDAAPTPAAQVAAMSELLRRAARRRDPAADRYHGADWLAFLDKDPKHQRMSGALGRLLLEGPFRREVASADVATLRPLARARYLDWMTR